MRRVHDRVLTIARRKQEVSIKSTLAVVANHAPVLKLAGVKITVIEARQKKSCVSAILSENCFFNGKDFIPRGRLTRVKRALVVNIYTPLKLFMKLRANVPTLNGASPSPSEISKKFSGKIIVFAYEDSLFAKLVKLQRRYRTPAGNRFHSVSRTERLSFRRDNIEQALCH